MARECGGCRFIVRSALLLSLTHAPTVALAQERSPDARALDTEREMTDDERFSLLISVMGANPVAPVRGTRIPEGVPMSAGYLGASFNPALAREAGAMLGREARTRGFNVLLGGGINLARDVRNGRNFEYFSEGECSQNDRYEFLKPLI